MAGRWTQYDEDEYRLPEGMKLTGYDADEQLYYFSDQGGVSWSSPSRYGAGMKRVRNESQRLELDEQEVNIPTRSDGYQPLARDPNGVMPSQDTSFRQLFPFFLIISVVLLLCWKFVLYPALSHNTPVECPSGALPYIVEPGDNCWEAATSRNITLDDFKCLNPTVNCENLMPGTAVCLPPPPP